MSHPTTLLGPSVSIPRYAQVKKLNDSQKPLHSANCLWIHTLQNVPEGGEGEREFPHSEPSGCIQFPAGLMKIQNVFIMWGVQIDICLSEVIGYFHNVQLWLYKGETP
jgi:hypothetical protein